MWKDPWMTLRFEFFPFSHACHLRWSGKCDFRKPFSPSNANFKDSELLKIYVLSMRFSLLIINVNPWRDGFFVRVAIFVRNNCGWLIFRLHAPGTKYKNRITVFKSAKKKILLNEISKKPFHRCWSLQVRSPSPRTWRPKNFTSEK